MPNLFTRLWVHISPNRKKQLSLLLLLTFFTSLAEVVSIGAVIPFLGILSNSEFVVEQELIRHLILILEQNFGSENLLLSLTVLFVSAAIVSGVMRIALLWGQTRLAHAIGADLSYQMYYRTLYQPFSVHASRNSSEVIAGISTKANQVVGQIVLPVLVMINSILILTAVVVTLVFIDPIIAISTMLGFSLIYGIFIFFTKEKLTTNGQHISHKTNLVIKTLQEGLGGIRDILIDSTQLAYCQKFRSADISLRRAIANNQIISQTPRYGVESLGIVLIAILAYNLGAGSQGVANIFPTLGALAMGAQRVLPLLQTLYSSWSKIRGSKAILSDALSLIGQSLPEYERSYKKSKKISFNESIILRDLGFQYNVSSIQILSDINLEICKGSKVGIIGETGSGKSTFLDIIMGLLSPTSGFMVVDGVEINLANQQEWQMHIAHIPQNIFLSDATVYENIAFGIPESEIDQERVHIAAEQAQISQSIESWEFGYKTIVGENGIRLSGGQRQRLGIARALYKKADVVILDEATSALDGETESRVMRAIENFDKDVTVIIVAHRITTLKMCDQIIELRNGKVEKKGSYADIANS